MAPTPQRCLEGAGNSEANRVFFLFQLKVSAVPLLPASLGFFRVFWLPHGVFYSAFGGVDVIFTVSGAERVGGLQGFWVRWLGGCAAPGLWGPGAGYAAGWVRTRLEGPGLFWLAGVAGTGRHVWAVGRVRVGALRCGVWL